MRLQLTVNQAKIILAILREKHDMFASQGNFVFARSLSTVSKSIVDQMTVSNVENT